MVRYVVIYWIYNSNIFFSFLCSIFTQLGDLDSPKHGKIDPTGAPHVGGNTWAGGTGGRDTAGMGGVGGPYRLDAGHDVHQVSDEVKAQVPEHIRQAARGML